jgi:hypothetical protein
MDAQSLVTSTRQGFLAAQDFTEEMSRASEEKVINQK